MKKISLAAFFAFVAGIAAAQTEDNFLKPDQTPVERATEWIEVDKPEVFKGIRKVSIASFQVFFVTDYSASANASNMAGLGGGGRDRISASLSVKGLDDAFFQRLTDELYNQAVTRLKADGTEVLAHDEFAKTEGYSKLVAAGDPGPLEADSKGGKGKVFSARGLPIFHVYEYQWLSRITFGKKPEDHYISLGDALGSGFKLSSTIRPAQVDAAKALDTPLLNVRMVITAASLSGKGGGWAMNASVTAGNSLQMPILVNRYLLITPSAEVGRLSLKTALLSQEPLGEIVDVTTSSSKVSDAVGTVMSLFTSAKGRGTTYTTKDLELRTSPDVFGAVAGRYAKTVNDMLADSLKAAAQ